jgi:hypothetical protein
VQLAFLIAIARDFFVRTQPIAATAPKKGFLDTNSDDAIAVLREETSVGRPNHQH